MVPTAEAAAIRLVFLHFNFVDVETLSFQPFLIDDLSNYCTIFPGFKNYRPSVVRSTTPTKTCFDIILLFFRKYPHHGYKLKASQSLSLVSYYNHQTRSQSLAKCQILEITLSTWLVKTCHTTCNNQSCWLISGYSHYSTQKIGLWDYVQCDQIGGFLKVFGDKISSKSSPNYCQPFGQCWKTPLLCKNCCCYFLGNFWKHLSYFLLQHLVTLITSIVVAVLCCRRLAEAYFFQMSNLHVSFFRVKFVGNDVAAAAAATARSKNLSIYRLLLLVLVCQKLFSAKQKSANFLCQEGRKTYRTISAKCELNFCKKFRCWLTRRHFVKNVMRDQFYKLIEIFFTICFSRAFTTFFFHLLL